MNPSPELNQFLARKSPYSVELFHHFVAEFEKVVPVTIHPAKTMIGIATSRKRIAYVTQIGKTFIHVVFPFKKPFLDNLCFEKIAQVPDDNGQYNHHLRIFSKEDVNEEVLGFMRLAFEFGC